MPARSRPQASPLASPLARLCLALIGRWQARGGGAAFGFACNFAPSCSHYAAEAIERHGASRGLRLAWSRFCRCSDPDPAGLRCDPVP